jgi:hypothetical protein
MLNRLLFLLTIGVALGLIGLVVFGPALVEELEPEPPRWLQLFASDASIRRAAIACAVGLVVTAVLFFRGSSSDGPGPRNKRPRSANTIGA